MGLSAWRRSVLVLCVWAASGWALSPNRALTQYVHRIWQNQQGLPEAAIRSIEQTSDGYLWLGTDRGLVRFDGVRFSTPGELAATPLATASIRQLAEDAQHGLWIATEGAGLFRLREGELTQFSAKNGLPSDEVSCVLDGRQGEIWACTSQGLARISGSKVQPLDTGTGFQAACQAPDGGLWAGGEGNLLHLYDGSGSRRQLIHSLPPFAGVQALLCARDGSLWIGSTEGLVHRGNGKETRFSKETGLPSNSVLSLYQGPDGTIWIGTHDGFSRYQNGELQSFGARDGLSQSTVFAVYEDREGNLWAGTKRGLNQFLDRRAIPFTTREGLPSNNTGPVLQDREGALWVGSGGAGLARFAERHWVVLGRRDGLSSNTIVALAQGAGGDLWIGTDSGLDRLVQGRVSQTFHNSDGLPSGSIRSLFFDREGTLWIGTAAGAAILRNGRIVPLKGAAGKPFPVLAFAEEASGDIYAGVQDVGVVSYDERSVQEKPAQQLPVRNVDALYSAKGVLWVGTIGDGLTMVEGGRVTNLSENDGLYDDDIYGIIPDDHGRLWMACSKGIFSVDPAELEKFRAGAIQQVSSTPYSPMAGLQTLEGRPGVQPPVWRMRDGHLCFAVIRGLIILDPDEFTIKLPVPQVALELITVDGRRMVPQHLPPMTPGSKNLAFTYTGLSFRSPQRITFRYILEGFDQHWTEAGTRRQAFYTNLAPGRYRFRVTACNVDGKCNEAGAAVAFAIPAPFYQRSWFIAACVLLAALVAGLAYRTRIEGIKRQFEAILGERSRIARELHDTLLQGFSGVTMQLQALVTKLPPHQKSVLEDIIHDAAHCLTEARRSVADLRNKQTGGSGLVNEIERIARQITTTSGMKVKLLVDPGLPALPAGVEYNLVRIAQEAVTNALKHSRGQGIKIGLRRGKNALRLSISDDGKGFDAGASSGNPFPGHYGLVGMRERAQDIGAEFAIDSSFGAGTVVRVDLRLAEPAPEVAQPAKAMGD
jgi:ligand-binding sensor domain-containing protein/signal transduction histidine kinase